ncbi:MAG: SpoIIE family protein phosphatase [Acidobacteriota bacterium]
MRSRLPLLVVLALLVIAACSFHSFYLWRQISADITGRPVAESPLDAGPFDGTITRLTNAGEAAGIVIGDRLVAVDGVPFMGPGALARSVWRQDPGSELRVTIESSVAPRERRDVALVLQASSPTGHRQVSSLLLLVTLLIASLTCIGIGAFVVAIRPHDLLAWVLLGLMLSFAQFSTIWDGLIWSLPRGWCQLATLYHVGSAALWPVWMMLFGLYFCGPLPLPRVARMAVRLLLVVLVALAVLNVAIEMGIPDHASSIQALARFRAGLGRLPMVAQMSAIGMFFMSVGWKSGIATSADTARRLNLMKWGAMISLTPSFLIVTASLIRGQDPFYSVPDYIALFAVALIFGFPLTLAYVIVVHRAMDVRVVLRLGLQYALAKGAVRTLQLLLSALVIWIAALGIIAGDASRPGRLRAAALGAWAVVMLGLGAKRVHRWTDRRFFREAYDAEKLLTELTEQMRTTVELEPLLETLTTRVSEALHVPKVALLLATDGGYRVAAQRGLAPGREGQLLLDGAVARALSGEPRPLKVYWDDPASWLHLASGSESDKELLRQLETQLLLPLSIKGELPGILSLGSKLSEEPYSPRDLRLLSSLAAQAALSLENTRLVAVVAAETEQRVRMTRELEIAREVQERLFPQTIPNVAGLELAGRCRPALGIGGDYYDFLALPGGRVGVAIGDVSGKGIPAALLMASLRAALRGQALGGINDLGRLMEHVNTMVYESSSSNRYATFFYAEFDPADRVLTYCNAGHNHPMVIRGEDASRQVLRLEAGGMVVGLMEGVPFVHATIALQSGDLVVMFTDGISEARNRADEEWGESALLAAIDAAPSSAPVALIDTLFAAADAFVDGAKQHDDMTLVVLRLG